MRTLSSIVILSITWMMFTGCPKKAPTRALKKAQDAISSAQKSLASKCAKDELIAAQKMMARAKKLMDEGKYEDAKVAFDATRKLAEKAKEEARLNRDNCLKEKKQPTVRTPAPPTVVASREIPIKDTRHKLTTIYFGFNQYKLTDETKRTLQKHAEWLNRSKTMKVQISGHCDQRGSVEYNLALGERRALAVKKFLINLGVSSTRISIISYGHQKPEDPRQTAEAYAKNRRAEFRVSSR